MQTTEGDEVGYRDEVSAVDKEVFFTARKIFKYGLIAVLVFVPLGWLVQSTGIVGMNIQREVVQHSQQYVETKVNLLNKLTRDWYQLESEIAEFGPGDVGRAKQAQQRNTLNSIETEAGMIPSSQIPRNVRALLAEQGR